MAYPDGSKRGTAKSKYLRGIITSIPERNDSNSVKGQCVYVIDKVAQFRM